MQPLIPRGQPTLVFSTFVQTHLAIHPIHTLVVPAMSDHAQNAVHLAETKLVMLRHEADKY